jgi:hypothetical protein
MLAIIARDAPNASIDGVREEMGLKTPSGADALPLRSWLFGADGLTTHIAVRPRRSSCHIRSDTSCTSGSECKATLLLVSGSGLGFSESSLVGDSSSLPLTRRRSVVQNHQRPPRKQSSGRVFRLQD